AASDRIRTSSPDARAMSVVFTWHENATRTLSISRRIDTSRSYLDVKPHQLLECSIPPLDLGGGQASEPPQRKVFDRERRHDRAVDDRAPDGRLVDDALGGRVPHKNDGERVSRAGRIEGRP